MTARFGSWQRKLYEVNPIAIAQKTIEENYGDIVEIFDKGKSLNKFGLNASVGTSFSTIAEFQGSEQNETFVNTNIIDSISSSSALDNTQDIVIEGHTTDGLGNLTFVTQRVSLDGQNKVTLDTPLCRANRAFLADTGTPYTFYDDLVGTIYIYDDTDGVSSGVPNTASATKLVISAGNNQSQKCATSISSEDYWIVTQIEAGVGVAGGNASRLEARVERRDLMLGGTWRPVGRELSISTDQNGVQLVLNPYLIIPKNNDVRLVCKTNSNTAAVFGEINGYLARIIP